MVISVFEPSGELQHFFECDFRDFNHRAPPADDKPESINKFCRKAKRIFQAYRLTSSLMATEVLNIFAEVTTMICPGCRNENEMAYSVLSNSLICLEPECGFELEMEPARGSSST